MTDQNPDREKLGEQDEPYTPSVEEARMAYGDARCIDLDDPAHAHGCPQIAEFDRMIARVCREAAAEQREKDAQIAEFKTIGWMREHVRVEAEKAWWRGVSDQWTHRPMGNRLPETLNPYRRGEDA